MVVCRRMFFNFLSSVSRRSCHQKRNASTYEGDGKTTAHVLNKELDFIMISSYSQLGFKLNSGIRLIGPSIIFARTILSWNIGSLDEVNENSLSLFSILNPKLDILVLGYGDPNKLPLTVEKRIIDFTKKHKIGLELLPTDNAVATFNFLNHERRMVAGAMIPPKIVKIYDDRDHGAHLGKQQLLLQED